MRCTHTPALRFLVRIALGTYARTDLTPVSAHLRDCGAAGVDAHLCQHDEAVARVCQQAVAHERYHARQEGVQAGGPLHGRFRFRFRFGFRPRET